MAETKTSWFDNITGASKTILGLFDQGLDIWRRTENDYPNDGWNDDPNTVDLIVNTASPVPEKPFWETYKKPLIIGALSIVGLLILKKAKVF